jgi:hypothetical protein
VLGRLVCVVGLVAVVACSAPSPASLTGLFSPSNHGPVDDLLDRRTQAFRHGDERAYLADLDQGQAALVQQERLLYANLRQLTFSKFQLRQFFGPKIAKPIKLEDGKPVEVMVVLAYQITGIDAGMTEEGFTYTFMSRNGKPIVTKIDYNTGGGTGHMIPWTLVPLKMAKAGNVIVAADPSAGDPTPLANAIGATDQRIRTLWAGRKAAPGTLVFASKDKQQAHLWFLTLNNITETSAWVFPQAEFDDENLALDDRVGGRMVIIVGLTPSDQVEGVYRHELTHAISAPVVKEGRDTPIWAVEGFAAWVEDASGPVAKQRLSYLRRAVRQGTFTGSLPANDTFYALDPVKETVNYAAGLSVFKFVAERWTSEKAIDFYEAVVSGQSLGDATIKVLTLDQAAFLQQWIAYVRALPA